MIREALAFSETGTVRSENQDAIYIAKTEQAGIFVVADGMGGQHKGAVASGMAVDALQKWWKQLQGGVMAIPFFDVIRSLERAIHTCNLQICHAYQREGQQGGTTLSILLLHGRSYAVINVGDSRIYCCERRKCCQLTVDDVWENQPDIRSLVKTVDLRRDSRYGKLTKAVGVWEQVSFGVTTGSLDREAVFFLCSDGVYKYCDEKKLLILLRKVRRHGDISGALEQIKKNVYQNGAADNLSAVLVTVYG